MSGGRQGALPVLGVAALSFSLGQTCVLPALPAMQGEFDADPQGVAWVVTAFLVTCAVVTPIAGRLGDMFGKRRVLLLALATMIAGSLVSAAGSSLELVVVGRVLAGVGSGGILPLCFGLVREALPPHRIGTGIGLVSATSGAGAGLGLLLGGLVIDVASYRWIFVVVAAIGAIGAASAFVAVPESRQRAGGRVDVRGALVLGAGVALPLVAIAQGNRWGWTDPRTAALFAAGLAILWGWVLLERRTPAPLLEIATMLRPQVLITNVATLLTGFGMLGVFLLTPQLAQAPESTGYGAGTSATTAGLILVPGSIAMLLLGPVSGAIGARAGNKLPLIAGCLLMSLGTVLLAAEHGSVAALVVFGFIAIAGVGLAFAAMPNLIVAAVPPARTGEATGVNALIRMVGAALGAQVTAAILAGHAVGGVPDDSGYTTAFVVTAGVGLLAAVAALFVPGSGGHRHAPPSEEAGAGASLPP